MDDNEKTKQFLKNQQHMVLAVTLDDGTPWAVPVKIQRWQGREFEWDSVPGTEHSKTLEKNSAMAITVFQKQEDAQIGFYATGHGEKLWDNDDESGRARYRFTAERMWLNDETFVKREIRCE